MPKSGRCQSSSLEAEGSAAGEGADGGCDPNRLSPRLVAPAWTEASFSPSTTVSMRKSVSDQPGVGVSPVPAVPAGASFRPKESFTALACRAGRSSSWSSPLRQVESSASACRGRSRKTSFCSPAPSANEDTPAICCGVSTISRSASAAS